MNSTGAYVIHNEINLLFHRKLMKNYVFTDVGSPEGWGTSVNNLVILYGITSMYYLGNLFVRYHNFSCSNSSNHYDYILLNQMLLTIIGMDGDDSVSSASVLQAGASWSELN